ncbi:MULTISPECIES: hypothetical protein [Caballeronia]|uniref:hypothetical protein n=1 Tax=Caballeronia TaxID=1827195 RepID=UPI001589F7C2|nr:MULTISPECIES: hypothetical protein [Caballeronia]MCG7402684.1 hypothetical protein [Caballeronia zhejiangensis]MCI1044191.1 hypothetical protein [Caballeronia zhejiangensis]MDR5792402.1 hypothetical protein [Caballeronia sp. LZ008]
MTRKNDPAPSGAPATKQQPASAAHSKSESQRAAPKQDAAKAEPVPHVRPPVRSDDN